MVEKLTERNLQLEEKIEALEEEKNDLVTCSFHFSFWLVSGFCLFVCLFVVVFLCFASFDHDSLCVYSTFVLSVYIPLLFYVPVLFSLFTFQFCSLCLHSTFVLCLHYTFFQFCSLCLLSNFVLSVYVPVLFSLSTFQFCSLCLPPSFVLSVYLPVLHV